MGTGMGSGNQISSTGGGPEGGGGSAGTGAGGSGEGAPNARSGGPKSGGGGGGESATNPRSGGPAAGEGGGGSRTPGVGSSGVGGTNPKPVVEEPPSLEELAPVELLNVLASLEGSELPDVLGAPTSTAGGGTMSVTIRLVSTGTAPSRPASAATATGLLSLMSVVGAPARLESPELPVRLVKFTARASSCAEVGEVLISVLPSPGSSTPSYRSCSRTERSSSVKRDRVRGV